VPVWHGTSFEGDFPREKKRRSNMTAPKQAVEKLPTMRLFKNVRMQGTRKPEK
jgi:hypothetical protein